MPTCNKCGRVLPTFASLAVHKREQHTEACKTCGNPMTLTYADDAVEASSSLICEDCECATDPNTQGEGE